MTGRITISLYDEVADRLKQVKKRLKDEFNVSAICQDALLLAIQIEEIKVSSSAEREKAIERLRLERALTQRRWLGAGQVDGYQDASKLSYDQFTMLVGLWERRAELEQSGNWLEIDKLPDDIRSFPVERIELWHKHAVKKDYLAGWLEGVMAFWNEVKDQL